jgi:hypothetical protein
MKDLKNYLIVVLGGLLAISLLKGSNEVSDDYVSKADLKNYQTAKEVKEFYELVVVEIAKLQGQILGLQNCLNTLEVQLGGTGREIYCP